MSAQPSTPQVPQRRRTAHLLVTMLLIVTTLTSACSTILDQVGLKGLAQRIVATPYVSLNEPTSTPVPPGISTAALVKLRSRLRVGIRFDAPPLASVNAAGEIEGLDVDIARELARRWLGSERNVDFVQVTTASAPRRMKDRELDLALGGLAVTRAADQVADFSIPYFTDGEALLIRTGTYADFASMVGKDVIYIDAQSLPALAAGQVAANITVTFRSEVSYANALKTLTDGQTEGVVGRWRRFRVLTQHDPAYTLLTVFSQEPVAIMLPQNDSQWADLVNLTLSAMVEDGFYARAYQKWFGAAPDPVRIAPGAVPPLLAQLADSIAPVNTMERIKANNSVRIGFVVRNDAANVLSGLDENSQPSGLEVEMSLDVAQHILPGNNTTFVPIQADQIQQVLATGSVEMVIGGIQRTGPNELAWDFSTATVPDSVLPRFGNIPLGIALPMNDSTFRDAVNAALDDMRSDGTYDTIVVKWLP